MNPNHSIPHLLASDSLKEFQASFSKWISIEALIDQIELKHLFDSLSPFYLLKNQKDINDKSILADQNKLIEEYKNYILNIREDHSIDIQTFRKKFHLFLTKDLDELYIKPLTKEKEILVFNRPLIEVKPISISISQLDQSIRSMPLSPQGIFWGFSISFPQIIQKAKSLDIETIRFQEDNNGILFKKLRKWFRENTKPTPFIIHSKKVNSSIRLGKNCFSWINQHKQLLQQSIQVSV